MDVPERTAPYFDLVLTQPIQAISGSNGEKIGENPPFHTRWKFEWTGEADVMSGARIYVLKDIDKIG